jgi:hypothetical protein
LAGPAAQRESGRQRRAIAGNIGNVTAINNVIGMIDGGFIDGAAACGRFGMTLWYDDAYAFFLGAFCYSCFDFGPYYHTAKLLWHLQQSKMIWKRLLTTWAT